MVDTKEIRRAVAMALAAGVSRKDLIEFLRPIASEATVARAIRHVREHGA